MEHVPPEVAVQHGHQVEITYTDEATGERVTERARHIVVPGLWVRRDRGEC